MRKIIFFILFLSISPVWGEDVPKNNRQEKVGSYLSEFVSPAFKDSYPNIYTAIKNVLILLPENAFKKVTDRSFPVLFTEVPHFGTGQWANSSGIYVLPEDPPTFTKGIWIVKLNTALNDAKDVEAIEGVIFHELGHRVLDHEGGKFSVEIEKEVNRLVKKWGFERQFLKARAKFGRNSLDKTILH